MDRPGSRSAVVDSFTHIPVLKDTVVRHLRVRDDVLVVDCTLGEGGHSEAILRANASCRVLGLDQDRSMVEIARRRLAQFQERFISAVSNFSQLATVLHRLELEAPAAVLMDLGISSYHFEDSGRGFSFSRDEVLDMRLAEGNSLSAAEVVNRYTQQQLEEVIRRYGEERWARRIAAAVVDARHGGGISSSKRLAEIVAGAVPSGKRPQRIHPATRTFQAIRMEVNQELQALEKGLQQALDVLAAGGRLCVISFHSLEDRMVKEFMRDNEPRCRCPEQAPICTCGRPGRLKAVVRKPITADESEIQQNPRARSAKLRVAEKL